MTEGQERAVMPVMEMTGITKRFGAVLANDGISFDLRPGEVHALVGENGAGKTTLMSILYGLLAADSGQIRINGEPVAFSSPADAIRAGIGMVHQHFMLVPSFSVAENITLGREPGVVGLYDRRLARESALAALARLGLDVSPDAIAGTLSVASQQKIEIAKVLHRGARIVILDEPTAVLTPQETEELWELLRRLAAEGDSIVFISHKLREVFAIADRITVLRGGRTITTMSADQTDAESVVAAMTGRTDVNLGRVARSGERGEVVLSVRGLSTRKPAHDSALAGVDLELRAGEVLGIAGVEGNGQSILAEVLIGTEQASAGAIRIMSTDATHLGVGARRDLGLGYVPEDRQLEGLPIAGSLVEGLVAGKLRTRGHLAGLRTAITGSLRSWARSVIAEYAIKAPDESVALRQLSGGNQQKVVVARELYEQPKVLLLCQPTRGVDLGAIDFIYGRIAEATARGCGVLLISADLDEILRVADRIAVMYRGAIVAEQDAEGATREGLGLFMAGYQQHAEAS